MASLVQNDWQAVHMSHSTITVGDVVFKSNSGHPSEKKASKSYLWIDQCHADERHHRRKHYEKVSAVTGIPESNTMLAVGEKQNSIEFMIKPAPGSRKVHLLRTLT